MPFVFHSTLLWLSYFKILSINPRLPHSSSCSSHSVLFSLLWMLMCAFCITRIHFDAQISCLALVAVPSVASCGIHNLHLLHKYAGKYVTWMPWPYSNIHNVYAEFRVLVWSLLSRELVTSSTFHTASVMLSEVRIVRSNSKFEVQIQTEGAMEMKSKKMKYTMFSIAFWLLNNPADQTLG